MSVVKMHKLMNEWMDRRMDGCMMSKGEIHPFLPHRIWDDLCLWQAMQQKQAAQVGSQTCLVLRSFLASGRYMELVRCFLRHPYGNLEIWQKFWYFVLFLFLVLTRGILFYLFLSASTDASWPIGSVNPSQPAPWNGSANIPYCLALL